MKDDQEYIEVLQGLRAVRQGILMRISRQDANKKLEEHAFKAGFLAATHGDQLWAAWERFKEVSDDT